MIRKISANNSLLPTNKKHVHVLICKQIAFNWLNLVELQLAITSVFDDFCNSDSSKKLLAASQGALSRMHRCIAAGGRPVETTGFNLEGEP